MPPCLPLTTEFLRRRIRCHSKLRHALTTAERQAARDLRGDRLDRSGRRVSLLPNRPVRRHRLRRAVAESPLTGQGLV
jgi:hypothetical protein